MLAIERRSQILSTAQQEQSVIVSELSKKFGVTEETIRRDLDKLEKEGFVTKTYGGAVYKESLGTDLPFRVREHSNKNKKIEIAKKIADLIQDGDTVMMDSSSTVVEIVRQLKDKKKITIITNSIEILMELFEQSQITVISTGGILKDNSISLVGKNALDVIKSYNVDKAIISSKGIHAEKGITDSKEYEVEIKNAMFSVAKSKILAVDSTKFNKIAFTKLFEISEIDIIATDKTFDNSEDDNRWIELFEKNDIAII